MAAHAVVWQQYNFLPPNDAKLIQQQYKDHIKEAIKDLLFEGEFLMNGVDDQVKFLIMYYIITLTVWQDRMNNFSNPALEVLCTSFYYGKNGLASLFPRSSKAQSLKKPLHWWLQWYVTVLLLNCENSPLLCSLSVAFMMEGWLHERTTLLCHSLL
jgi:hypothetical protein